MSFLKRFGMLVGLATPLAVIAATGIAPPANAFAPAPELNLLPQTLTDAGLTGDALGAALYSYEQPASLFSAASDVDAGTATASETAQVAAEASTYSIPATEAGVVGSEVAGTSAAAGTVAGAGVVAAGLAGMEMGFSIGKGAATLFGMDPDKDICQPTFGGSAVSMITLTNCSAYNAEATDFKQNQDSAAQGATVWNKICDSAGTCVQLMDAVGLSSPYTGWEFYRFDCTAGGAEQCHSGQSNSVQLDILLSKNNGTWGNIGLLAQPSDYSGNQQLQAVFTADNAQYGWLSTDDSNVVQGIRFTAQPDESSAPASGSTDPARQIDCVATYSDGSNSGAIEGPSFTETQKIPLQWPLMPATPAGLTVSSYKCDMLSGTAPNQTTQDITPKQGWQVTPSATAQETLGDSAMAGKLPLSLWYGGKQCVEGTDSPCAGWYDDAEKADQYTCKLGTQTVDLDQCTALAHKFDADVTPGVDDLSNPKTGVQITNPSAGNPDAADQNAAQQQGKKCWPSGWSAIFNPLSWVEMPVQCAATWAFVAPASTVSATRDSLASAVNESAVGTIATDANSLGQVNVAEGCGGIPFEFHMYSLDVKQNLLAACPGDTLAPTAAIVHTILTAVVVSAGFLASLRYVAIIFGFSGMGKQIEVARLESAFNRRMDDL